MKRIIIVYVLICVVVFLGIESIFSIDKQADIVQGEEHETSEYVLELDYKDDFRILQLGDIHLGTKDNADEHFKILTMTINDADADLIVITGDILTYADKRTAKQLFDFIDSFGIPWTCTFGNHDEQCLFSIDWLTDYLNNYGSNCKFIDIQGDNVFGNSNFAINLMEDNKVNYQILLMDSNRYYFGDYIGYDYIKQSQIDWYERILYDTYKNNNKEIVNSILFMHIPLPEFNIAWYAAGGEDALKAIEENGGFRDENSKTGLEEHKDYSEFTKEFGTGNAVFEYGYSSPDSSAPKYNSGLFDEIKKMNSTKAVIVSHDHTYNSRILYKGVYFVYGVNSTDRVIKDDNMIGGQVVVIHKDHSLTFDHIYHTYKELDNE